MVSERPPADHDSSYRALVRDVALGSIAVVLLSLAVPAWIIRTEYRKTYQVPARLAPAAEVLRERSANTAAISRRPPDILEFAEQFVRQEAEKREVRQRQEAEKREARQREAMKLEAERASAAPPTATDAPIAVGSPLEAVAPIVSTPPVRIRESMEAP